MVSAKTPAAETARLAELFTAISKMDETRAFYERLGAIPMTGGPAQMHEFQKNEIALWKRIVVKAKVPPAMKAMTASRHRRCSTSRCSIFQGFWQARGRHRPWGSGRRGDQGGKTRQR
jgi:hypothetical protein